VFFIASLAVLALGSTGAMVFRTMHAPRWDSTGISTIPVALLLSSTVVCDAMIAGVQVYLFLRYEPGSNQLIGIISKLAFLAVNAALLTSVDVVVFFALFMTCPHKGIFIIPYLLLSNCHLCSILSTLNARILFRTILNREADFRIDAINESPFLESTGSDIATEMSDLRTFQPSALADGLE